MTVDSAVVLAAGEGKRLRPLTQYRPKPLLPAANRPILEYVLDSLLRVGVTDLHLVVGYGRERVQNHFGPTYRGRHITYHVQENQLGSGHALLQARHAVDSDMLVVNGDEVAGTGMISSVVDAHRDGDVATLAVTESEVAPQYGAIRLEGDTVTELVEKPGRGNYRLQNAGSYVFHPSVFDELEAVAGRTGELGVTDAITRAIERGEHVRGVRTDDFRIEATYPWDLLDLADALLESGRIREPERAEGRYVGDAATVHPDATLVPPVVVGNESVVSPGAVLGPGVALGTNVTVETGAVVRRTILDDHTRVGSNATLVDTVTGTGVTVGAGVTVPDGPGDVRVGQTVHPDREVSAVFGDRADIGGGVTVLPGTLVGPDASVAEGVVIEANVDSDVEVRR